MSVGLNSLSSSLMLGNTLFRNQSGVTNKFIGQFGYAITALVATVETIAAMTFSTLALITYPFSATPFNLSTNWLGSSAFSFGWAVVDFFINPFSLYLIADEKTARKSLDEGNIIQFPRVVVHLER